MSKKSAVSIRVDENFFKVFEKERQKEQDKLRSRFGNVLNLSQTRFTEMLAKKNFRFSFPRQTRRRKI